MSPPISESKKVAKNSPKLFSRNKIMKQPVVWVTWDQEHTKIQGFGKVFASQTESFGLGWYYIKYSLENLTSDFRK